MKAYIVGLGPKKLINGQFILYQGKLVNTILVKKVNGITIRKINDSSI